HCSQKILARKENLSHAFRFISSWRRKSTESVLADLSRVSEDVMRLVVSKNKMVASATIAESGWFLMT
ncbi:MAG TPA: hypothetical protein VIK71_00580, partial [Flavobacteriales bacterium]